MFNTWQKCRDAIHGFPGAKYKSFPSRGEAENAFNTGNAAEAIRESGIPIWESMCVDAACSGNPGLLEYRAVDTATRKEIFHEGPFQEGTNNIGEFLAIVHALALCKKKKSELPIYSDSSIAIGWVKAKKTSSKLIRTAKNKNLFELITRAEKWLQENSYPNKILKWETRLWGENPADFGRK